MGEINETDKGTPSEVKAPPSGEKETTPKEPEPQTHTQTQVNKAVHLALSQAGRTATALEARETTVKAREDAAKEAQDRKDAAELVEAQKDPDKLAAYQSEQAQRQRTKKQDDRDAAQTKREAEHEAEIQAAKETQREIVIFEIATAKGVDPVRLKNLSTKLNIEGKENLEELAAEIASGKPKEGDKNLVEYGKIVEDFGSNSAEAKSWRLEHPDFEADNALTKGGGEKSEEQRLKERYPTM